MSICPCARVLAVPPAQVADVTVCAGADPHQSQSNQYARLCFDACCTCVVPADSPGSRRASWRSRTTQASFRQDLVGKFVLGASSSGSGMGSLPRFTSAHIFVPSSITSAYVEMWSGFSAIAASRDLRQSSLTRRASRRSGRRTHPAQLRGPSARPRNHLGIVRAVKCFQNVRHCGLHSKRQAGNATISEPLQYDLIHRVRIRFDGDLDVVSQLEMLANMVQDADDLLRL